MTCASCGAENREEARYCDACGAALAARPSREQRKVVTVLFCDVSGSTALGESLDPEAMRALMARYFDVARVAIERHGGTLEKFIGDAVMAVFGVPTVREDDALRAVRAAQELRDAVEIDVRIGVNTGEVVTGSGDSLVTGDAVNVAARLEQAASAGEVLLGAETYSLVRGAVDVELLPPIEAKGKSEPVTAYRLVAVTGDVAVTRRADAPLVGRERERRLLADAWERAATEKATALFTVLGVAGVGKSRLAAEFLDGIDATVVRGRCLSYGDGITYWPVVEVVRQLLDGDPPSDPTIAALLGNGQATSDDIAFAVRQLFERAAAERPLVVLFDDLHWAEPTFLDLIEHVADWSRDAPIMLLCLGRPELVELRSGWGGGKLNATTVLLEPLSAEETDRLISALLSGRELQESLRERIRAAAEGNPLFVEQMLAMVELSPGEVAVPSTIQALLSARLDQLPTEERSALERGAVEGQIFHRGAVQALTPDETSVAGHLMGLVRKQLVRPTTATLPGDDAFRFRHLLIRDAAYDALPKASRADLHERFAEWIELRAPDLVELDEILGYHLEQAALYLNELGQPAAGIASAGAKRLARAGRRAVDRDDASAAANLLGRASALGGDSRTRARLLPLLGLALYEVGDLEGMHAVLDEASGADDVNVAAQAFFFLNRVLGHAGGSATLAELRADVVARLDGERDLLDSTSLAEAHLTLARLAYWQGSVEEVREHAQHAVDHARRSERTDLERAAVSALASGLSWDSTPWPEVAKIASGLYEESGSVSLLTPLGYAAATDGRFDEARRRVEERRRRLAERGRHLEYVVSAMVSAYVEELARDWSAGEPILREAWDELGRIGERGYRATIGTMLADALIGLGRLDEAESVVQEAESFTSEDDFIGVAGALQIRALIAVARGDAAAGIEPALRAVEISDVADYIPYQNKAWLTYARVLLAAGHDDDARAAAEHALELSQLKQSRVLAEHAREILAELTARTS